MPRFYFDTHDGAKHTRDDEGLTLSGLDDAREHALRAAGEMVKAALPDSAHRFRTVEVLGEDTPSSRFRSQSRFRRTAQSCRAASGGGSRANGCPWTVWAIMEPALGARIGVPAAAGITSQRAWSTQFEMRSPVTHRV